MKLDSCLMDLLLRVNSKVELGTTSNDMSFRELTVCDMKFKPFKKMFPRGSKN